MSRRTLIAAVLVVLAVIAGAAVYRTSAGTTDGTAGPSTTTGTTVPGRIHARSTGTGVAADGITPIGWPSTCDGAIQAATTVEIASVDTVGTTDYGTPNAKLGTARPGLDDTLARIFTGNDANIARRKVGAHPEDFPGGVAHPEWGGYRLVSCTAGQVAVVDVFSCGVLNYWPATSTDPPGAACGTTRWTMVWGGTPTDWRAAAVAEQVTGTPRYPGVKVFSTPMPITAETRRAALAKAGPQWQEYADAPQ